MVHKAAVTKNTRLPNQSHVTLSTEQALIHHAKTIGPSRIQKLVGNRTLKQTVLLPGMILRKMVNPGHWLRTTPHWPRQKLTKITKRVAVPREVGQRENHIMLVQRYHRLIQKLPVLWRKWCQWVSKMTTDGYYAFCKKIMATSRKSWTSYKAVMGKCTQNKQFQLFSSSWAYQLVLTNHIKHVHNHMHVLWIERSVLSQKIYFIIATKMLVCQYYF